MKFIKGQIPWNKGKKIVSEPSCKILRRNPEYYLNELRTNAIRAIEKGYHKEEKRVKQMEQKRLEYNTITKAGSPRKDWSKSDIQYLKDNYDKLPYLEICKYLERSWSSVNHKISRLKLRKYTKWN